MLTVKSKKSYLFFVSIFLISISLAADIPNTFKSWEQVTFNFNFSNNICYTVLIGHKHEFYRAPGKAAGSFLAEFETGPVYTIPAGAFTFKLPLYYYYLGFILPDNSYLDRHNMEFSPSADYKTGRFSFTAKYVFHCVVYSRYYKTAAERLGLSILSRQLYGISCKLSPKNSIAINFSTILFALPDQQASPVSYGFQNKWHSPTRYMLAYNRIFSREFSLGTTYFYEILFDQTGRRRENAHYILMNFNFNIRFF